MATYEEEQKLRMTVEGAERVKDLTESLREEAKALDKTQDATDKASGATRNFGRAGLEAGRMLQDFTQGGLGGILNNLEGLTFALGGPAGLAGLITGVGVAAYAALPQVRDFFDGVMNGINEVPKTTDALERMNEELEASKNRLGELKKQQSLTNQELAEYNKLLSEQAGLEKQVNDERERRAAWEAQLKKEREENEPERPESAAVVGKTLSEMGGAEKVTEELTRKMGDVELPAVAAEQAERLEDLRAKQKAAPSFEEWNYLAGEIAKVENMLGDAQRDIAERAKGIVQGALTGDETQIRNLAGAFPRGGFDKATPEAITNAKIEAKRDADAKEAERQEAIGQRERQAQEQRALIAKQQGEEQWQKRKDAEDAKARADSATMAQRGRQAEMADQDEANRAQAAAWGPAPQETDAMEMAMVQAKAASMSAVAQADAMLGVNSEAVQLFKQLEARFNHLQMRNSQQMGGQMGGGGHSQLPMYMGGM